MHFGKTSFLIALLTATVFPVPVHGRQILRARAEHGLSGRLFLFDICAVPGVGFRHNRWVRHQPALRLCTTGRLFQSQDAPPLSDRDVGPVPPEIMLGWFGAAGLIVTIVYSVVRSSVF